MSKKKTGRDFGGLLFAIWDMRAGCNRAPDRLEGSSTLAVSGLYWSVRGLKEGVQHLYVVVSHYDIHPALI